MSWKQEIVACVRKHTGNFMEDLRKNMRSLIHVFRPVFRPRFE